MASRTAQTHSDNQTHYPSEMSGTLTIGPNRALLFAPDKEQNGATPAPIRIDQIDARDCESFISPRVLKLLIKNFDLPVDVRIESDSSSSRESVQGGRNSRPLTTAHLQKIPPINPTTKLTNQAVLLRGELSIQEQEGEFRVTLTHKEGSYDLETSVYPEVIRSGPLDRSDKDSCESSAETMNHGEPVLRRLAVSGDSVLVPCTFDADGNILGSQLMVVEYPSKNADQQLETLLENRARKLNEIFEQNPTSKSAEQFAKVMTDVANIHTSESYRLILDTMRSIIELVNQKFANRQEFELSDDSIDTVSALVDFINTTSCAISGCYGLFSETVESSPQNTNNSLSESINSLIQNLGRTEDINSNQSVQNPASEVASTVDSINEHPVQPPNTVDLTRHHLIESLITAKNIIGYLN